MKKLFLLLLLGFCVSGFSLTIAEGKKSSYQIVVPDATADKNLDGFVELGGKLICSAVRKAAGAEVPLVKESRMIKGKPAIFVGNTKALKAAGLSSAGFAPWEHAITVKGKNIFIYGKDETNPLKNLKYPHYFIYYINGSLKGACTFAERFLNTRFVGTWFNSYGENDGVRTLPQAKITVPDDFSYRRNPRFRNRVGDSGGLLFSVANNYLFDVGAEYRVHYHAFAIPQAIYYKTNPEYFALIDGKRYFHNEDGGIRPQYCLSNPEVQKLIYQEALKRADDGLKVIELGQSDGFRPCECAKCKAWYNTSDWGEKLWCFHRDLAAKLAKDRPNVTVAIAAYEPTHQLPKTFKKFPGKGVIIDLAPTTPALVAGFKDFNIRGIVAWTYYFGSYKASGFSPANPFSVLQREAKKLCDSPVSSFYHCGLGTSPHLTGPWSYLWGRMLENPALDVKKELAEYCLFAFGKEAAPHFLKFFTALDERLEKFPLAPLKIEGGYDPAKGNDFSGPQPQYAVELWNQRYPADVMKKLDELFFAGIKAAGKGNYMVEALKREYEYMRRSAAVCHAATEMEKSNTFANRCKLADAITARNDFLNALPRRKHDSKRLEGQAFYGHNIDMLKLGGYMYGIFRGAFHSDPAILKKEIKNLELIKVKDFNDPAWAKIPAQTLLPFGKNCPAVDASFKVAFTDKAVLLKLTAPVKEPPAVTKLSRDDRKLWKNTLWELFFTTGRDTRQFSFSAVPDSRYDSIIFPKKYKRAPYTRWSPVWQHKDKVVKGVWTSEVTIPFAAVGGVPAAGSVRELQVGFSLPGGKQVYAWNASLTSSFADITGFGKIRFGKRNSATVRKVGFDTQFLPAKEQGFFTNWVALPGNLKMRKENNALVLEAPVKSYLGIYYRRYVPIEADETAEITVKVSGKGKCQLSLGFFDNAGNWIVNKGSKNFPLTDKGGSFSCKFRTDEYVAKGAAQFQVVVFLQRPGGVLKLEDIQLKLTR